MQVDPNKIIDNLRAQLSNLQLENAVVRAQYATLAEAYNKMVAVGDVAEDAPEAPAEVITPDEVIDAVVEAEA